MKKFLSLVLALAMLVSLLAGCGAKQGASDGGNTDETPVIEGYKEAPMLAELVAKGDLPAVEERLPDTDNVYVDTIFADKTKKEVGTFGGVLKTGIVGSKVGDWILNRSCSLERPVDFYTDGSTFLNVLKDIEHNEDSTVWTMHLREGIKWSDGEPFTSEDVVFWYYMMHKNNYDDIAYWAACYQDIDGERVWADVAPVDDYTVTWTFAQPQYATNFVETGDMKWCWAPAHFWKDKVPSSYYEENPYYPDPNLTDEQVLANFLAIGREFASVRDAGKSAYKYWKYWQYPTLHAYMLTDEIGFNEVSDPIVKMVRNPYYWKVDAQGQQLPYIDEMDFVLVNDQDQAILMLESGELDYITTPIDTVTAIQDAMGDGVQTKVLTSVSWGANQMSFNLTHPDEEINALLNNLSFRQALSIAVDRKEVVELWYDGLTEPTNCAPQKGMFGYTEENAYRWTEYNPELAKEMLTNDCGLTMGNDGFFYFPSGKKVSLTVVGCSTGTQEAEQWAVLKTYFDAVGIEMNLLQTDEHNALKDSNQWDVALDGDSQLTGYRIDSRPKQFVPLNLAATWYSMYDVRGTAAGDGFYEPVGEMKTLCDMYTEWLSIPELKDRDELELKMMQLIMDNMWVVAYSSAPDVYYMVSSKVQNWPEEMPNEDKFNFQYQFAPYTWYFAE